MSENWWQITDFATIISEKLQEITNDSKASVHYNTVDKWFKALENKRIHYITRAAGEKIYNEMDLEIGLFIAEKRKGNRYRLDAIYELIPDELDVRPFPPDFHDEQSTSIDESLLERRVLEKMNKFLAQQFEIQQEQNRMNMQKLISDSLQKMLPNPISAEEERAQRMTDNITRMRVEWKLEEEAIVEWEKLPEKERTKRVGVFRKDVDVIKREQFIRNYKKQHLEDALKKEYDLDHT